jgi:hypothetical protein
MDAAKINEARKAGYSDQEIADFMAASNPKIVTAREAGYSDREILDHFAPPPSPGRQALDAVGDFADRTGGYLRTQGNRMLGGVAGLPRMALEGIDWIGKKDAEAGGTGARVPEAVKNLLPTPQEATAAMNRPQIPTSALWDDAALEEWKKTARTPRPELTINPVVDAAVQGAMSLPFMGATSLPAVGANIGAPVVSEVAGQLTEGTDYEVPARLMGGVLGAAGGAAVPSIVRKGVDILKAPVAPFTGAGRERLAGQALRDAASSPDDAVAAIERYQIGREAFPDAVPGFRVNAGQASRDPGLMAAADILPDKVKGAQVQANNARVTEALDRAAAGLPPADTAGDIVQGTLRKRYDDLVKARSQAVDPLYEAARKSPTPVKPFPLLTYTADAVAANKGEPQAVMQKARNLLFTTDKNGRVIADRSARGLMATREALNDMLSGQDLGNHSRSLLMEMKSKVDAALEAVPQAKAANAKFAEMSRPLDPFNADLGLPNKAVAKAIDKGPFGKDFTMPAAQVPSQFMRKGDVGAPTVQKMLMAAGGDPKVKQAMASAYIADFRKSAVAPVAQDAAGNPMVTAAGASRWLKANRGGAANVLTPEQLGALDDIARNLADQAQPVPGRTGSPTFNRLASESIIGALVSKRFADAPVLHPVRRALGLIYGGADEAIEDIVFKALEDPAVTKALMKKATEGNVKLAEPVLRSIGRGAALGAVEAGQ